MANVSSFSGAMPVIPGGTVELGYLPKTSTVPVNAGSGSQVSVVGPLTVVCDGSPIMVEFYCEEAAAATTAGAYLIASLWVDGAETTRTMGVVYAGATGSNHGETLYAVQRIIPAAGSHTIEIKGWSSAAGNFYAAAGGTAAYAPMWLRVSKIVNQNDGLKPFWTPPVVTQLPSQATNGDQVLRQMSSSGQLAPYQYVNGSWRCIAGGEVLVASATISGSATYSFDNVFTSEFDNYRIVGSELTATGGPCDVHMRLRAAGSDLSTSSYLRAGAYTVDTAAQGTITSTGTTSWLFDHVQAAGDGRLGSASYDILSPARAVRTLMTGTGRNYDAGWYSGVQNTSASAYDGFTLYPASGTLSGRVKIYAYLNS